MLAGLKFAPAEIAKYLPITEEIMLESPIYREIVERGLAQGLQQGLKQGLQQARVKDILRVLEVRFGDQLQPQVIQMLESKLTQVQDADRLDVLLVTAVRAQTLQAFTDELERVTPA